MIFDLTSLAVSVYATSRQQYNYKLFKAAEVLILMAICCNLTIFVFRRRIYRNPHRYTPVAPNGVYTCHNMPTYFDK